jgi:phage gp29-like protein
MKPAKVARSEAPVELFNQRKARWQHTVAAGLTPVRLGEILRRADRGDNLDLLTLGVEAPERDNDLFADLQTRSLSIWGAPLRVKPVDDTPRGKKIAENAQKLVVNKPNFRWLLQDLMDAVLMSYAAIWPVWDMTTSPWTFKDFQAVDQRQFQFDKETLLELRMRQDGSVDGVPLPLGFVVHYPRIRSGLKLRGGLIRLCAVNWLFKTSTVSDWMAFAEVFGMPIRLGKYNPETTSEDEQATMREALVNLGHDAACMIPEGMSIEIVDARRPPSGDNLYKGLATYFDTQRQKAILGTAPSLEGSSAGQGASIADQRREVRQDLRDADALACSATCDTILNTWVDFNYGPTAPRLHLEIDTQPAADIVAFTEAILPWVREAGLEVPLSWLLDRLQIPEARKGEKMLKAPALPGAVGGDHAGAKLDGKKRANPRPGKA